MLDEFDKAHTSFHSAFYQLFDEGIYEDQNYHLNLKKSVIICTSNYKNLNEVQDHLGSAIYSRFDNIVQFNDLTDEAKQTIGTKIYDDLNDIYDNELSSKTYEKLTISFNECQSVREIKSLIEDTFALSAIKDMIENN
ncbi:hypothetical protein JMA_26700 [Jeotgalibacillus malaysiensis]|uniref:ATPase AAA-type core domain-containing protein n=1 Tax=Jeotgalibacillus malaysiensis TaxID=1508404 RepID=A0A0B5ATE1_9BACL|nr:hypothetical protein JMA_26700 [Jeotgalibacillus malaysiensis]